MAESAVKLIEIEVHRDDVDEPKNGHFCWSKFFCVLGLDSGVTGNVIRLSDLLHHDGKKWFGFYSSRSLFSSRQPDHFERGNT